jgi:phosphatidylglycerophosphatase A
VTDVWLSTGGCSLPDLFTHDFAWPILGLGFLIFRGFDIAKPWPISAAQHLPRGWGVILDDVLAALCTAAVILLMTRTL